MNSSNTGKYYFSIHHNAYDTYDKLIGSQDWLEEDVFSEIIEDSVMQAKVIAPEDENASMVVSVLKGILEKRKSDIEKMRRKKKRN